MDYEKMLDEGRATLPETLLKTERFEIPKVRGHIQGNRTVISNFFQIADTLRRPVEHILKFILKELATPGNLTKSALMLGRKVPASMINDKIIQYANQFVICKECKKPDTKLERDGNIIFLKCTVCGAKTPVSTKV